MYMLLGQKNKMLQLLVLFFLLVYLRDICNRIQSLSLLKKCCVRRVLKLPSDSVLRAFILGAYSDCNFLTAVEHHIKTSWQNGPQRHALPVLKDVTVCWFVVVISTELSNEIEIELEWRCTQSMLTILTLKYRQATLCLSSPPLFTLVILKRPLLGALGGLCHS